MYRLPPHAIRRVLVRQLRMARQSAPRHPRPRALLARIEDKGSAGQLMQGLLVPIGLCQCGCGNSTPLAKRSDARWGHIIGQPVKWINGHNARQMTGGLRGAVWKGGIRLPINGYPSILMPDHHRANVDGYVFLHIVVAERALGHPLIFPHQVHHVNEQKHDYRPGNLVLCEDYAYHALLHQRARAHQRCGHASWLKCTYCKQYDAPDNLVISIIYGTKFHRRCESAYQKQYHKQQQQKKARA